MMVISPDAFSPQMNLSVVSGIGDEIQEVVDKILSSSSSGSDRSEVLGHVLASLQKKDPDNIFANPVDTTLVFDYLDVVADPMDFKPMCVCITLFALLQSWMTDHETAG